MFCLEDGKVVDDCNLLQAIADNTLISNTMF